MEEIILRRGRAVLLCLSLLPVGIIHARLQDLGPRGRAGQEFFLPASSVAPWESRAEDPACNKAFFCLTLFWEETLSIYNVSGTIVSAFCI